MNNIVIPLPKFLLGKQYKLKNGKKITINYRLFDIDENDYIYHYQYENSSEVHSMIEELLLDEIESNNPLP